MLVATSSASVSASACASVFATATPMPALAPAAAPALGCHLISIIWCVSGSARGPYPCLCLCKSQCQGQALKVKTRPASPRFYSWKKIVRFSTKFFWINDSNGDMSSSASAGNTRQLHFVFSIFFSFLVCCVLCVFYPRGVRCQKLTAEKLSKNYLKIKRCAIKLELFASREPESCCIHDCSQSRSQIL